MFADTATCVEQEADEAIRRQMTRFLASGCSRKLFTKALYRALHLNFGFIAHYDLNTFWEIRFQDEFDDTAATIIGCEPWLRRTAEAVAIREAVMDYVGSQNGNT